MPMMNYTFEKFVEKCLNQHKNSLAQIVLLEWLKTNTLLEILFIKFFVFFCFRFMAFI